MTPSHANKAGRRYRYYITASDTPDGKLLTDGWGLPAGELEELVRTRLTLWLKDESSLVGTFAPLVGQDRLQPLLYGCGALAVAEGTRTPSDWRQLLRAIDARVRVAEQSLSISFCPTLFARQMIEGADVEVDGLCCIITVPASLVRRGQELRLAYPPQVRDAPVRQDVKLIGLIAKAEAAYRTLVGGAAIEPNRRNIWLGSLASSSSRPTLSRRSSMVASRCSSALDVCCARRAFRWTGQGSGHCSDLAERQISTRLRRAFGRVFIPELLHQQK